MQRKESGRGEKMLGIEHDANEIFGQLSSHFIDVLK